VFLQKMVQKITEVDANDFRFTKVVANKLTGVNDEFKENTL